MEGTLKIFENGSNWLRTDFHLHTNADNEFDYQGDSNFFVKKYLDKLEQENIKIGSITNHNKFDLNEFKELRKNAVKREIYLIPGIEFSVNDGAKGIHVLINFNDEWIYNKENTNYIEQFLNSAFTGVQNPEKPPYPNSNYSLFDTFNALNSFKKDYFFILAHVDDENGMFSELKGRNFDTFIKSEPFSKRVLGLQKARSFDNQKQLKEIIQKEEKIPSFVEGTDNAHEGIEGLGNSNKINGITQKTFLKLGAYNFEAVKYSLMDKQYRLSKEILPVTNGYIKDITFKGQKYEDTIHLSHSMNNLIGIRGSGKSSILEVIRYALDIELSENENVDYKYKRGIVNAILGSGGKIITTLIDDQRKQFRVEKTLGDIGSKVFNEHDELQIGLKPNAIVKKPIYFGQKDLSKIGDSLTTENLISKLVGDRLLDKKREIDEKNQQIIRLLDEINKIDSKIARKQEFEEKLAKLKHNIQVFKDNEIDKKLEKQINFNKDVNFIKRVENFENKLIEALDEFINEYDSEFIGLKKYVSKEKNIEVFDTINSLITYEKIFITLRETLLRLKEKYKDVSKIELKFNAKYEELKEEFAEEKRKINLPSIQADDYVKFTKDLDITNAQLSELEKMANKKVELQKKLTEELVNLQGLWHNEFEIIREEINNVNKNQPLVKVEDKEIKAIEIKVAYRENNEALLLYLKDNFRGSSIRENNFKSIVEHYPDLISLYSDLNEVDSQIKKILSENQLHAFKEYFKSNIGAYLTYRTPDKFEIIYRGRPLGEHSLGQRASALIIFLLTLKDSDLIIIDQPEDDLDNQTIYNDVIKVLKQLKNTSQFIFATHNPNIPVLGDCEQLIVCKYDSNNIKANLGSIDDKIIRQKIVNIMEGGEEAFNNRKIIYELWTH